MNCKQAQRRLPGYLDGAMRSQDHVGLREHLDSCASCRQDLDRYRLVASRIAQMAPVAPPADLAVRIRMRASRERTPWAGLARAWSRAMLVCENILGPLAVPATGGVLTTFGVFVLFVHGMLGGIPLGGVVPNDLPLNLVQPAEIESLAPFPVVVDSSGYPESGGLLLEATLDAQGEVVFYKILSGPKDVAVQRQIDELLMFSRFRPQLSFGRPMGGGRVLLSFSEVHVRG